MSPNYFVLVIALLTTIVSSNRITIDDEDSEANNLSKKEWMAKVLSNQHTIIRILNHTSELFEESGCTSKNIIGSEASEQLFDTLRDFERSQKTLEIHVDALKDNHDRLDKRLDTFKESLDMIQEKLDKLVSNEVPIYTTISPSTPSGHQHLPKGTKQGPKYKAYLPGAGGLRLLGFGYKSHPDSFFSYFKFNSIALQNTTKAPFVRSKIIEDGEECLEGQVMAGIGDQNTNDPEKDDQRLYCTDLISPLVLTSTCVKVTMGLEPRPRFPDVDTSNWVNWLNCPGDQQYMTKLYWTYDPDYDPVYPYRYTAAECCLVLSQKS